MALDLMDVDKIATLSRLALSEAQRANTLVQLNNIFTLVEQMQTVNTDEVVPLHHPHELALRLREDEVTATDCRALCQPLAPAVEGGLYLVPTVID